MIRISWGLPDDYEEIVSFADDAFGEEVQPGGFAALLPKLYRDHPEAARRHLLLREGGRLRALLLCDRKRLWMGGESLSAACIGTVSVSPQSRGRGYMGLLLNQAEEELSREGCVFAALGGQRQRYERFGYFPAGLLMNATLTQGNLRRLEEGHGPSSLTAEPMPDTGPLVSRAAALHRSRPFFCGREDAAFSETLRSWRAEPYILLREGEFSGYLTLCRERDAVRVTELAVADPAMLTDALLAVGGLMAGAPARFSLPVSDIAADGLAGVCQEYAMGCSRSFRVFDLPALAGASLRLRAELSPLPQGETLVPLEAAPFLLTLSDEGVRTRPSDRPQDGPALTAGEATQLLFSLRGFLPAAFPGLPPAPAGWLPLPLCLPLPDAC